MTLKITIDDYNYGWILSLIDEDEHTEIQIATLDEMKRVIKVLSDKVKEIEKGDMDD